MLWIWYMVFYIWYIYMIFFGWNSIYDIYMIYDILWVKYMTFAYSEHSLTEEQPLSITTSRRFVLWFQFTMVTYDAFDGVSAFALAFACQTHWHIYASSEFIGLNKIYRQGRKPYNHLGYFYGCVDIKCDNGLVDPTGLGCIFRVYLCIIAFV